MDDISEVFFYPAFVILVNKWESVLLESAPFFCTFADAFEGTIKISGE